jgi:hypothetical protein
MMPFDLGLEKLFAMRPKPVEGSGLVLLHEG